MTKRFPSYLLVLLATASCSRESYFQPDARVAYPATLPADVDSVLVTAGRHYQRGPIGRLLLGAHYRKVWATPVTLPVFKPATVVKGGLQFGKLGGGFQTTSATLVAANGRSYALRSIDKDPYKTLPKVLRQGFVLTTVRDATSAGMPYGAFVVPILAQAAGIPHSTPRPYYIRPDEDGLGAASERLRGKVVMLEEKVEGEENIVGALKGASALEETDKMLEARYHTSQHAIDEAAFLRARLLDLWIGDWDRHEGQWNWAAYGQSDGKTLWRPVPQDRDQVFFRFDDGLVSWLVSRIVPKFRTFKPHYESIEGYTRNASFIDERALSSMPRLAYSRTAQDLQQRLTDEVIHRAVQNGLPRNIYALEGAKMEATLRARRAALPQAAEEYYQLRARRVVVAGTDQAERFVVERLSDTATVVSVYALDTKRDSLLYRRQFNPSDTRHVVLHGLGGKDVFTVTGSVARSPFIDIYGGPDEDTINDSSWVSGLRKKTQIYDTKRNTVFEIGRETKDKRSRGVSSHAFDRDGSGR